MALGPARPFSKKILMMPETTYNGIGKKLVESHGILSGQMFGKPCLKSQGKAFAAFHQDQMVFKLGKEQIEELRARFPDAVHWDPSGKGRAMKDWLQVPHTHSEEWEQLALLALDLTSHF